MHNLKINIFPRLPFHPPITVPQRIKFVSETGSAGRESESERVWKSRVRSRDANASDGSFPLFAAHFCRRAPPSRFYRGPETVHRRCRRYAGRIELNGAKGGGKLAIRAWKTFLADDSIIEQRVALQTLSLSLSFSIQMTRENRSEGSERGCEGKFWRGTVEDKFGRS